jgi:hypothetical protein
MFDSKNHTKINTSSKNMFSSALRLHELCRPSKNHTILLSDWDPVEPEICTISGTPTLVGGVILGIFQEFPLLRECGPYTNNIQLGVFLENVV